MHKNVHSIAKHKGMLEGLTIKDRNECIYFVSHWTAGADYHYKNEYSSEENGEDDEKDSDYEPESDSDSKSKESNDEDDDEDNSHQDLQEKSDDSESDSDDEWANETFVDMPGIKVSTFLAHLKTNLTHYSSSLLMVSLFSTIMSRTIFCLYSVS